MLKKHQQFFSSILWLIDMLVVLASFALSYNLRFFWQHWIPSSTGASPVVETRLTIVAIVLIWSLVFRMSGLYQAQRTRGLASEGLTILKASLVSTVGMVTVFYFFRDMRYSRLTLGLFALFSFVNVTTARLLLRLFLRYLRKRGHNLRHAIIVGGGQLAETLIQRLEEQSSLGIEVLGIFSEQHETAQKISGTTVLGPYAMLKTYVQNHAVDQVYLALPLNQQTQLEDLLHSLSEEMIDIRVVPDLVQFYTLRGGVEDLGGLPIVHLQHGPAIGWDAVSKRGFDLLFASLLLLALSPLMLFTALLVKLSSPGPIFYRQERMGLDGRLFGMLKFRSMRIDAEDSSGAVWAKKSDGRTTWVGQWIRRLSIDELPQFLNVLIGDMSLVGPRPERPVFIEQFKKELPRYNLRHKVKAGVTGLAQVEGWRGQTSLEKRIERDLFYIEHWSLWLDFKILLRTAFGGFLSRNAY